MTGDLWALLGAGIGLWVLLGLLHGRRRRAVKPMLEVVEQYRRLARQKPMRFAPAFAASLHTLGLELIDTGQPRAALVAIQEAVDIYRLLAREAPDRFGPALTDSLAAETYLLEVLGFDAADIVRTTGEDHSGNWAPFPPRRPLGDRIALFWWSVALVSLLMSSAVLIAVAVRSGGIAL